MNEAAIIQAQYRFVNLSDYLADFSHPGWRGSRLKITGCKEPVCCDRLPTSMQEYIVDNDIM